MSRSNFLRTVVPTHIIKKMGLSKGDAAEWGLDKIGCRLVATISKKDKA